VDAALPRGRLAVELDLRRARAQQLDAGHARVVGVAHDRRERPVDVEQDRRAGRVGAQRLERLGERGGDGHGP
jgi:hypothetical protein